MKKRLFRQRPILFARLHARMGAARYSTRSCSASKGGARLRRQIQRFVVQGYAVSSDAAQTDGTVHGDIRRGKAFFTTGASSASSARRRRTVHFAGNFRCAPGQRVRHALGVSGCPGVLLQLLPFRQTGRSQAGCGTPAAFLRLSCLTEAILRARGSWPLPGGDERVARWPSISLSKLASPWRLASSMMRCACVFAASMTESSNSSIARRFHAAHGALLLGCFLIHARHLKF